jgi:hypothetical protein
MQRFLVRFVWCAIVFVGSRPLAAQTIETPIPFDSAGRVMAVSPVLASRLRLEGGAWPVNGAYREARLYSVQPTGGFVLVVQRSDGALARTPLTDAQRDALRTLIDAAMITSGRPMGESGSEVVSEPAGFAFARDQALLGLWLYGPLAASLPDNSAGSGAAYLLAAGTSFFAAYGASQSYPITRAQNDLAAHLAVDGAAEGALVAYAANSDDDRATRAVMLGGAVAGSVAGLALGRPLTDAESHAASAGITMTGLTTWGVATAFGGGGRGAAAAVAASAIAGYGIGLQYPRRASYPVTAGDVTGVYTSALLGAGVGGTIVADMKPSPAAAAAVLTPAYVAGAWLGDRLIAKPYNLTESQGRLLQVGAGAGALIGLALPVLAQSDDAAVTVGFAAAGGIIGASVMMATLTAHHTGLGTSETGGLRLDRKPRRSDGVHFDPVPALVGVFSRAPGRYSLLNWTF